MRKKILEMTKKNEQDHGFIYELNDSKNKRMTNLAELSALPEKFISRVSTYIYLSISGNGLLIPDDSHFSRAKRYVLIR